MQHSIGQKINELRKRYKMTQDELAQQMGVSPQAVSKWETDASIPDLPTLIALADFFHVSLDELVREKNETVTLLPNEQRKPIEQMLLRIRVLSSDGDRVNINLPLGFVRIAAKMNIENFSFNGSSALKSIDFDAIIALIESGIVGKIVEVESGDGDTVEIFVES